MENMMSMSRDKQFDYGMEVLVDLGVFHKHIDGDKVGFGMTQNCIDMLKSEARQNVGMSPISIVSTVLRKFDSSLIDDNVAVLTELIICFVEAHRANKLREMPSS